MLPWGVVSNEMQVPFNPNEEVMAMRKNARSLGHAAKFGFLENLRERVAREGAVKVQLKPGGITEAEVHAYAVANRLAFLDGILTTDRRRYSNSVESGKNHGPLAV